jgi:hypothetical protein
MNKTGTTSLRREFSRQGYIVGNERKAEMLYKEFFGGDYEEVFRYIETGEVFQDFPFSFPKFYEILERKYPDARFILSVRNSSDEWFDSLVRFHSKVFGNGTIPTEHQLKDSIYVEKGMAWIAFSQLFKIKEGDLLYDRDKLVEIYEKHNRDVREYFIDKPRKLLELDLSETTAYREFCAFLDLNTKYSSFPWENKTTK